MLSAALTNEFTDLAYVKAGLDRLKLIGDSLSSIYARKLVYEPPVPFTAGTLTEWMPEEVSDIAFWTGHIEQANLVKELLSLRAAVAVAPHAFLHDLALSVHTSSFTAIRRSRCAKTASLRRASRRARSESRRIARWVSPERRSSASAESCATSAKTRASAISPWALASMTPWC